MVNFQNPVSQTIRRLALVILGSALLAFNINTFIYAGALIPGGFTGVTLLLQEIFMRYLEINLPFSLVYFALNAVPAAVCFKFVGRKFTLYSILSVFLTGLMTDFMPPMFTGAIQIYDVLLSSVFGGILNAVAVVLCLRADASSGGTDFIAMYISEKYRKDAWNYIFAGNCVILIAAGVLFSLERALYSIIFQFTTTVTLTSLYQAYQQKTLLIITNLPGEVYNIIRDKTNHGATRISGTGLYKMEERSILYSIVYSNEVAPLIVAIKNIDPNAFINVIKTEQLDGHFFKKPKD